MTAVLIKGGNLDTETDIYKERQDEDTQEEDSHVIAVLHLQVKERKDCQRTPEAGRDKEGTP